MSSSYDFVLSPLPTFSNWASLPQVTSAQSGVLALSALSTIGRVVFTQTQQIQNVHQFQVFFADARSWLDELSFPGSSNTPTLTRLNDNILFAYAEWNTIVALRLSLVAMHNILGEPSLIQYTISTGDTTVVLDAAPLTASAGVGTINAAWHSPLVGHLDWVALYAVGAPNTSYLSFSYVPDGVVDGNHDFATPGTAGSYEFRYLVANSFTSVATTQTVVVS